MPRMRRHDRSQKYTLDPLFRRFELTIPLKKPVVVRYRDLMTSKEIEVSGLPMHNLVHVLYLMTMPGRMIAIPKSSVESIRALYPEGDQRS